ncbi:MAG: TolC family protein [Acidobacteriota bacterium]
MAILVPGRQAAAEETLELDLQRVVEIALARNPALQAEAERRVEVAGGVDEVAADAWPQLDLVNSWSRSRNPSFLNSPDFEDIVGLFPDFEPGEQEQWDFALRLEQTLYSGGKVRAAIDLAELVVDITEAQIGTVELDTALAAVEAYHRLQQAKAALATVEIQRQARQLTLEAVEGRFELGAATQLEMLRARSSLASVEPEIARIRGDVDIARSRLRVELGLDPQTPVAVADPAPELPEAPALADLLAWARAERPELRDLELQAEALGRQRVITVADGRPQLELSGSYGRQVRLLEDVSDALFDNWVVSLGLTWSLFDGGRRKGELVQLESQKQQLEWQREDLERRIAHQLEEALAGYRTALERLTAAEVSAEASQEASRVALESYREGAAIQADLLDAQEEATRAELVRVEAVTDAWVQAARLLRATGRLPTRSWSSAAEPLETPAVTEQPEQTEPSPDQETEG